MPAETETKPWAVREVAIIENIQPVVSGGMAPVKVVQNQSLTVCADIFAHGQYTLAARIQYRQEGALVWEEAFMKPVGNDRWEGQFTVRERGVHLFRIVAWVDEAASWQQEVSRKIQSYQPITELLFPGRTLISEMSSRASTDDKVLMQEALRLLSDEDRQEEAGQLAMSFRFSEWINRYPDRGNVSESAQFPVLVNPSKTAFSNWYTMYPRSASPSPERTGTLKDVLLLLPRIAALGFDVLHFPPIHPIGYQNRKGKNGIKNASEYDPGSVYAIGNADGGHETVNPDLGTAYELKLVVGEAAILGIDIALDMSLLFSPDHPWSNQHTDWFVARNVMNLSFPDAVPLHITNENWQDTKSAILEIIGIWVSWGIKIIRIDKPEQQPLNWWSEITFESNTLYPDLVFYAGTFTRPKIMNYFARSGFALSDSYFFWRNNKYELEQLVNELNSADQRNFYRPVFWTNSNQINPFNLQSGHEPQHLIRLFLAATLSGVYGIYGPVFEGIVSEGFPGKEDYWNSEKYEIKNWDWSRETKLTYLISLINTLRLENGALQQMGNIHFCELQNEKLMAYLKTATGSHILCIVNLDAHHRQAGMVKVPLHLIGKVHNEPFTAHDLITGARYKWQGEWNYIELDPSIMPFHLLRIEVFYNDPGQTNF